MRNGARFLCQMQLDFSRPKMLPGCQQSRFHDIEGVTWPMES